jgi:uncharacterized protein YkwD
MKKALKISVIAVVITAIIVLTAMPFGAIEIKRYYGDINNDANVTTQDVIIALSVATGIYQDNLTSMDFEASDMDNDNSITTNDARLILKTAAGQEFKRQMEGYEFSENPDLFLKKVNEMRVDEGASSLKLSKDLCDIAREAAEEYATKTGTAFAREDGSYYYSLLDEKGVSYTMADKMIIPASFGYKETFDELVKVQQSKKALCSKNFKKFGIGAYTKDGHTFYWCIFLTD